MSAGRWEPFAMIFSFLSAIFLSSLCLCLWQREKMQRPVGMNSQIPAIAFLLGLLPVGWLAADDTKPAAADAAALFGPTKVWVMHLEIPAKEYEAMQPALPAFPGGGGPGAG